MTERQANERRNWKGILFPYDVFIPDESEECSYCLTDLQATFIRGLLEPTGWPTRWWSDDTEVDRDKIEAFRDDIIRRLMMACCGGEFEIIFRWTEDGVLQKSEDGGTTWDDSPENDPRNSSTTFPPVPGEPSDDKKCIAATGVKTLFKEQIGDQLTDDMSRYTLGQLLNDWVTTVIQTSNPFRALITIITNQILALTISLVRAALTDDVYDKFACCVLNNMADDLSFDQGQWEDVRECISTDITGIAGVFLEHLVFLIGEVGLTNLARSQAVTEGDCDCDDGCHIDNWTTSFGTEVGRTSNTITVTPGVTGGLHVAQIRSSGNDDCCLVSFSGIGWGAWAWWECGQDPDTDSPTNNGTLPNTTISLNCVTVSDASNGSDVTFHFS